MKKKKSEKAVVEPLSEETVKDGAALEAKTKGKRVRLGKHQIAALAIAFLGIAIGLVLYFLASSSLIGVSIGFVFLVAAFLQYGKDKEAEVRIKEKLSNDFIEAFAYFSVYIQNGFPVYRSLELTTSYSSEKLGGMIETLLRDIDLDKSLKPYLAFAERFSSPEIRQVMIAIERMAEEGGSALYIQQFRFMFASLEKAKRKERRERYVESLSSMGALPLLASALSIALVTVAVLSIMGGYAGGF